MFCDKCGSFMEDDAVFCPECGGSSTPTEDQSDKNVDLENQPQTEDTAMDLNIEGMGAPVKKRKKLPILIGAAVVAVAAVLLVIFNFDNIKGFFQRTFSSPEEVQKTVYEDAIADAFGNSEGFLGSGAATVDLEKNGISGEIKLTVDDSLLELLGGSSGVDMDFLSDITIGYDAFVQDQRAYIRYDALLNSVSIITAEQFMDMENMEMWMSVPDINDQAIYMNIQDIMNMAYGGYPSMGYAGAMPHASTGFTSLLSYVPSEEVLNRILTRYVDIFMGGFKVEKENEKETIDGVTQTLHVLKAKASEEDIYNILIDIIETMIDDKDIEEIIVNMEEELGQDGLYESFVASLEEGLNSFEDEDMEFGDGKIYFDTYLNDANDIVGIKVTVSLGGEKVEVLSWLTVEKGKKFATEISLAEGMFVIEGSGEKNKTMNGTYDVIVDDEEILSIKVSDYVNDKNELSGKIRITPSEEILEELLAETGINNAMLDMIGLADPSIELSFNFTSSSNKLGISVCGGNTKLVTLSISTKQIAKEEFSMPEDAITVTSEADLERWLQGVDEDALEEIMDRLADAGLPIEDLLPQQSSEAIRIPASGI